MIWLTWRQFRVQALTATILLTATAIYLALLGQQIRDTYTTTITNCQATQNCTTARDALLDQYTTPLLLTSALLIIAPLIIGIFWGAPLITRELETGTHRFIFNQSITRTRWLTAKLTLPALTAALFTGLLSLLLTWAASPYDQLQGERFTALNFISRNITPIGYAVFAFILATTLGLLTRRTLPAMALTLTALLALQTTIPLLARPHLQTPLTTTINLATAITADARINIADQVEVLDYVIPGAWILDSGHTVLDKNGNTVGSDQLSGCLTGNESKDRDCLAKKDLHFNVSYQPADRYWTFQWIELAGYFGAAALLAAFSLRRIRRPLV